jgi:hypothetical protein
VASRSEATDKSGKLKFINLRAEIYWKLREALDPSTGENLALPPDPLLLQDLTAPQWSLTVSGIKVESKDDIKKRIGRSTDSGDAVALACYSGSYGEKDKVQAGSLAIFGVNPYGNTGGNERNTTGPGGNYYSRRGW